MGNPLRTLLDLTERERAERGLEHTPREIGQQPDTWKTTYQICANRRSELNDALRRAGIGRGSTASPTVYLVGAGTSDYVGRALGTITKGSLEHRRLGGPEHDTAHRNGRLPPARPRVFLDFVL